MGIHWVCRGITPIHSEIVCPVIYPPPTKFHSLRISPAPATATIRVRTKPQHVNAAGQTAPTAWQKPTANVYLSILIFIFICLMSNPCCISEILVQHGFLSLLPDTDPVLRIPINFPNQDNACFRWRTTNTEQEITLLAIQFL